MGRAYRWKGLKQIAKGNNVVFQTYTTLGSKRKRRFWVEAFEAGTSTSSLSG
jgi:hypothetical protein